ncbi:hypothetical protein LCGC14_2241420, partial [marine sediment metagenome]
MPRQIRESQEEKTRLESQLALPSPDGTLSRGEIGAQLQRVNKFLEEGTPPPTTPERRDELGKRITVLEKEISENMPTREAMVRKVPGTGDHHGKWEKANKPKIFEWKDARRELDPTNEDVDYTNVEILRRQNDLSEIKPFRQFKGVDMRDGEIVPGGIPDAEKIEARIAEPETAVAVLEQEEPLEAQSFTVACDDCHFTRTKDTKKKADSALRM